MTVPIFFFVFAQAFAFALGAALTWSMCKDRLSEIHYRNANLTVANQRIKNKYAMIVAYVEDFLNDVRHDLAMEDGEMFKCPNMNRLQYLVNTYYREDAE